MDLRTQRALTNACLVLGVSIVLFGLTGFQGGRSASSRLGDVGQRAQFPFEARVEIAVGAALVTWGWLLRRRGE